MTILSTNSTTHDSTISTIAYIFGSAATLLPSLLSGSTIYYSSAHHPHTSKLRNQRSRPNLKQPIRAIPGYYSESRYSEIAILARSKSRRDNFYAKSSPAFGWRTHTPLPLQLKMRITLYL